MCQKTSTLQLLFTGVLVSPYCYERIQCKENNAIKMCLKKFRFGGKLILKQKNVIHITLLLKNNS